MYDVKKNTKMGIREQIIKYGDTGEYENISENKDKEGRIW
jgi:hypothetical protein